MTVNRICLLSTHIQAHSHTRAHVVNAMQRRKQPLKASVASICHFTHSPTCLELHHRCQAPILCPRQVLRQHVLKAMPCGPSKGVTIREVPHALLAIMHAPILLPALISCPFVAKQPVRPVSNWLAKSIGLQ